MQDYFFRALFFGDNNPKICSCWSLAKKTSPLATIGTRFALLP